jgi:voltage-gated potassium channel
LLARPAWPEAVVDGMTADRFTQRAQIPMLILSVLFIAVLVTPIINDHLSHGWAQALAVANIVLWAAFAAEYCIRLVLAPKRIAFVRANVLDLFIVAVPMFRPLRIVRLVAIGSRVTTKKLQPVGVAIRVFVTAGFIVFLGAVGVLDVERHATGASIHTFGDAIWWACTTVTTVGYGDKFPVTAEGRVIAVLLMLTGIAILGVGTALIASWFVQLGRSDTQTQSDRIEAKMDAILALLADTELAANTGR